MAKYSLKNQSILITGANRGIGAAIAVASARRGSRVILGVRDPADSTTQEMRQKLEDLSAIVEVIELNLSSRADIEDFLKRWGAREAPDVVVHNAGVLTGGLIESQSVDEIYLSLQVNLVGVAHLTRELLPSMLRRGSGCIVVNSSVSGVMNFPLASTYSAAKTGVLALANCVRAETQGTGVRVLSLLTPGVKTRMFDEIPKRYGAHLDLDFLEGAISADAWAAQVCDAIEAGADELYPRGATRAGLWMARHVPGVFQRLVASKFNRSGS
jgi:short-subunit dehydrogenase